MTNEYGDCCDEWTYDIDTWDDWKYCPWCGTKGKLGIKMSLELFLDSIKSKETKKHYSTYLQIFLEFAHNKLTENKVIEFILQLKKK